MIVPARWHNGGMNLNAFRDEMIHDRHLIKLFDFYNAKECFPTVEIAGGLCYFLIDKNTDSDCTITNIVSDKRDTMVRPLDEFGNLFIT